jgi:hypothetical protein
MRVIPRYLATLALLALALAAVCGETTMQHRRGICH